MDEHTVAHDDHNSPEQIRKEVRTYLIVFALLGFFTIVTVGLNKGLDLPLRLAIPIGLAVACIKAFLVAGFFMHLLSEKKLIYSVLIVTVLFFAILLWIPWNHWYDAIGH